jgi:hypothetical protein
MSGGLGRLKIENAIWNFGILDKKNYKMMFMLRADGVSHPQMTTQVTIIS